MIIRSLMLSLYLVASSVLLSGLVSTAIAMEEKSSKQKVEGLVFETFPYKPLRFSTQIAKYEAIYDKVNKDPGNFENLHIPELFNMFQIGLNLVVDYMETNAPYSDAEESITEEETRARVIAYLNKIYAVAVDLFNNQKFTQENFIFLNLYLAYALDVYKMPLNQKIEGLRGQYKIIGSLIDNLTMKSIYQTWQVFNSKLRSTWPSKPYSQNPDLDKRHVNDLFAPIILYSKKSQGLSPDTFIDQLLNEKYPRALLLFDASSKVFRFKLAPEDKANLEAPDKIASQIDLKAKNESGQRSKVGSKNSPHFGTFDGTMRLLWHDISHILEQNMTESGLVTAQMQDLYKQINAKRLELKETNKDVYQILTNGLFILNHELLVTTNGSSQNDQSLADLVENVRESMIEAVDRNLDSRTKLIYHKALNQFNDDYSYKVANKDLEHTVRDHKGNLNRGLDGQTYLPENFRMLPPDEKQKAMKIAYEKFWDDFLTIAVDEFGTFAVYQEEDSDDDSGSDSYYDSDDDSDTDSGSKSDLSSHSVGSGTIH